MKLPDPIPDPSDSNERTTSNPRNGKDEEEQPPFSSSSKRDLVEELSEVAAEEGPRRSKRIKDIIVVKSEAEEEEDDKADSTTANTSEGIEASPAFTIAVSSLRSRQSGRKPPVVKEEDLDQNLSNTQRKNAKKGRKNKGSADGDFSWHWLCSDCLRNPDFILNREVQVWWPDDVCSYSGILNAYDERSECYRILYNDDEWEFLYLSHEGFLIAFPNKLVTEY